jgi:hypothetical protein
MQKYSPLEGTIWFIRCKTWSLPARQIRLKVFKNMELRGLYLGLRKRK